MGAGRVDDVEAALAGAGRTIVLHGEAGIGAQALADQIGVSKRTIYRDLEGMDLDGGLPIWNEKGRFGLDAALTPARAAHDGEPR